MTGLEGLLNAVNSLLGLPISLTVLMAAAVLVIAQDWRLLLAMLMVQTIGLALLASRVLPVEWAAIHVIVVGLIALMWFMSLRIVKSRADPQWTLRQMLTIWWRRLRGGWRAPRRLPPYPDRWLTLHAHTSLRALVVIIVALAAFTERSLLVVPGLPIDLATLCGYLLVMVALGLALSDDPLRVGLALTTGLTVFWFTYLALAPSMLAVGIVDGLELLMGLACSYLIIVRGATTWARQGEQK